MKNSYKSAMEHITLSNTAKERILSNVMTQKLAEKKKFTSPLRSYLRPAFAAAAIIVIAGSVFAVSRFAHPAGPESDTLWLNQLYQSVPIAPELKLPEQAPEPDVPSPAARPARPEKAPALSKPANRPDASSFPTAKAKAAEESKTETIPEPEQEPKALNSAVEQKEVESERSIDLFHSMNEIPEKNAPTSDMTSPVPSPELGGGSGGSQNETGAERAASVPLYRRRSFTSVSQETLDRLRVKAGFAYKLSGILPAGYEAAGDAEVEKGSVTVRFENTTDSITLTAFQGAKSVAWEQETEVVDGISVSLEKKGDRVFRAAWMDTGVSYLLESSMGLDTKSVLKIVSGMV